MAHRLRRAQYIVLVIISILIAIIVAGILFDYQIPDAFYIFVIVLVLALIPMMIISEHTPKKVLLKACEKYGLKHGRYLFDGNLEHRLVTDYFRFGVGGNIGHWFVRIGFYTKIQPFINTYIIVVPKSSKSIHNRLLNMKKKHGLSVDMKKIKKKSFDHIKGLPLNMDKKMTRKLRKYMPYDAVGQVSVQIYQKGVMLKLKGEMHTQSYLENMIKTAMDMMKETEYRKKK